MKKLYPFLLFCSVIISVTSCSTGSKSYQHGDYYKACLESIDRLRSSPKNTKAQSVLVSSYPLAQQAAQREIDNALIANGSDKYDVSVYQYDRLNQLANQIYNCPKALELIPHPTEYIAELSKAKQLAADQAYELGTKALGIGTLDQARVAYQYFQNANRYVNGYKDVLNKINESKFYATLRVIVQRPYTNANFQYSADFFYNNLLAEIRQNAQNRFVRYYTPEEARKENMNNPHQYIALNFEDFSVGDVHESTNTAEYTRDSVIVGTVKVEGKIYNSYNTVKARLTTFHREISSGGILSLRIIDAQNNQVIQQQNFAGNYVWNTNWAKFKGDDRALDNEQKKMCNREPQTPPSDQDLFIEFTKPIYSQAVSYIRSAHSRY
ncbi:MAG: hypothetical protein P4L34_12605 [Paludibacter sp.]|nr:hypothetical protein [Paludibacter sp.]